MIEIKKFRFHEKELMQMAHKIRYEVFVVGQKCPEEIEWEFEEESTHFLVIDNNKPVATARHRKTKDGYKLERFAVVNSSRRKGYGSTVLKAILNDLKNYEGLIYMHAQSDVLPFYQNLGFIIQGDEFEEAGILHYKMSLKSRKQ